MHGISIKAVVIAVLVMVILDTATGMALVAILGGDSFASGMSEQQMTDAMLEVTGSSAYLGWGLVLGTLTTVIGGFIAASVAKSVPYLNAFVFGLIGILIGALTAGGLPLWLNVVAFASTLPAALLGGHIAKRRLQARQ